MAPENTADRNRKSKQAAARFTVRRFRSSDVDAIFEVMGESAEAAKWSPTSVLELSLCLGGMILIAEAEGKVGAFFMARQVADEAEILNCAVRSRYRRQGQADALLAAALESFRRNGVARVLLEVRESNHPAIKLYEGHGFRETRRRPGYYREPEEAAVCMEVYIEKKVTG